MTDRPARRPLGAAAALALVLGVAAAPGAAQAQFFGGWGGWDNGGTWDGLAPGQVRRSIVQQGFRVLAPLRRNGAVYVADVADGRGRHERLIVAAADAQILQRFIVDDGRGFPARGGEGGFAGRGGDDDRPLVPPADIPDAGRRFARPAEGEAPPQRFGDLGAGGGEDAPAAAAEPLRRPQPPVRVVRPRPRVVERAPEGEGTRAPGAVESTPLEPAAPRAAPASTPASPPPVAAAPRAVPAAMPQVASRPEPAAAPAAPAQAAAPAAAGTSSAAGAPPAAGGPAASGAPPAATATRRMSDPLAIPGGDAGGRPVRNVASGITGAPAPAPAKPAAASSAKPGDVPVAPLD